MWTYIVYHNFSSYVNESDFLVTQPLRMTAKLTVITYCNSSHYAILHYSLTQRLNQTESITEEPICRLKFAHTSMAHQLLFKLHLFNI